MGSTVTKLYQTLIGKKQTKLMMLGLYFAGKTTILEQLKIGKIETKIPIIGFQIEIVQNKNLEISSIDTGHNVGWIIFPYVCREKDGLIFVIDSMDRENLKENQKVFSKLMTFEEFKDVPILILLNKSDKSLINIDEIVELLELRQLNQKWTIQNSCALTGEGIVDGLEWILKECTKNENQ